MLFSTLKEIVTELNNRLSYIAVLLTLHLPVCTATINFLHFWSFIISLDFYCPLCFFKCWWLPFPSSSSNSCYRSSTFCLWIECSTVFHNTNTRSLLCHSYHKLSNPPCFYKTDVICSLSIQEWITQHNSGLTTDNILVRKRSTKFCNKLYIFWKSFLYWLK